MPWATPQYDRPSVDSAGRTLTDPSSTDAQLYSALEIINNWRSAPYFPLNALQNGLRQKAKAVYKKSLIAQRIKRLSSINAKLRRKELKLTLSEMQDIGGCRAVLRSSGQVYKVVNSFKVSRHRHTLVDEDDYISRPKNTGYRGYHLIYRFKTADERYCACNDLKVEIQLRSYSQHAWATAVETVGLFTRQALKSSIGEKDWLRFFKLMSSYLASMEHTPWVPNTPSSIVELKEEIRHYCRELKVLDLLPGWIVVAGDTIESGTKKADYRLVELDADQRRLTIRNYTFKNVHNAIADYLETEKNIIDKTGMDAVLLSVDSVKHLRRAYPNYYGDTTYFLNLVRGAIETS